MRMEPPVSFMYNAVESTSRIRLAISNIKQKIESKKETLILKEIVPLFCVKQKRAVYFCLLFTNNEYSNPQPAHQDQRVIYIIVPQILF